MNIDLILNAVRETLPDEQIAPRSVQLNDTFVRISAESIITVVQLLIERFGLRHLSAITGLDNGKEIEILYHFFDGQGLTLHTVLDRGEPETGDTPHIASITGIVPGAAFYELEISEMLGVTFDGHRGPDRLLLPDDWDGTPPLRREEDSK